MDFSLQSSNRTRSKGNPISSSNSVGCLIITWRRPHSLISLNPISADRGFEFIFEISVPTLSRLTFLRKASLISSERAAFSISKSIWNLNLDAKRIARRSLNGSSLNVWFAGRGFWSIYSNFISSFLYDLCIFQLIWVIISIDFVKTTSIPYIVILGDWWLLCSFLSSQLR